MRRRSFIRAAVAVAAVGTLPGAGRAAQKSQAGLSLLALAETVAPDGDRSTWHDSPVAEKLLASFAALEENVRERYRAALDSLDSAARGGLRFLELGPGERATVLRELEQQDNTFRANFGELRSLILSTYFSSENGLRFAGYRDTNQFTGYPEYLRLSVSWE